MLQNEYNKGRKAHKNTRSLVNCQFSELLYGSTANGMKLFVVISREHGPETPPSVMQSPSWRAWLAKMKLEGFSITAWDGKFELKNWK